MRGDSTNISPDPSFGLAVGPLRLSAAAAQDSAPIRRRGILVVDDNRDAADILGRMFRLFGHEVTVAYGGEEGLAAYQKHRPRFVFLDIAMPDMDGYEVARRIRTSDSGDDDPVLVAVTGFGQESDKQRSLEAGFDHHLTKPPSSGSLQDILHESAD